MRASSVPCGSAPQQVVGVEVGDHEAAVVRGDRRDLLDDRLPLGELGLAVEHAEVLEHVEAAPDALLEVVLVPLLAAAELADERRDAVIGRDLRERARVCGGVAEDLAAERPASGIEPWT